ncbi:hypothetical protein XANCAGTX0491_006212 [Xanthoria calcicola]
MPSRRLRRPSPTPLHRRILRGISNAGAYLTGWNAPAGAPRGAPVVIGAPRLISSSLDLFPEDIPGRPRNHDANQQAEENNNDPTSPAIDYESEELRLADLFRRVRLLSNDAHFQHLSPHDWNLRIQALDWYREEGFVRDLANGRHDGFAEALRNQEHDSYYSDLWQRISNSDSRAAAALQQRVQPHRKPKIALTVPPRYEPSDLPSYTATVSPPNYCVELPEGHISKDVPLCTDLACPLRVYGIEHTQGLYNHEGQPGPRIHPGGSRLPSFGQSNPPPNVWHAYNLLILDVNNDYEANLVKAFVRLHGRPWTAPEDKNELRLKTETRNPSSGKRKSKSPNHADRWAQDQVRRIPRYSYDKPAAPAEPRALDETRLTSILTARGDPPRLPDHESLEAVMERNTTIHYPYPATIQHHRDGGGHRHGTVRVCTPQIHQAPVHLPGIGEVMDQGIVTTAPVPARRLRVVNPDIVGEEETVDQHRSIRFADEMDGDANQDRRA